MLARNGSDVFNEKREKITCAVSFVRPCAFSSFVLIAAGREVFADPFFPFYATLLPCADGAGESDPAENFGGAGQGLRGDRLRRFQHSKLTAEDEHIHPEHLAEPLPRDVGAGLLRVAAVHFQGIFQGEQQIKAMWRDCQERASAHRKPWMSQEKQFSADWRFRSPVDFIQY